MFLMFHEIKILSFWSFEIRNPRKNKYSHLGILGVYAGKQLESIYRMIVLCVYWSFD